MCRSVFTVGIVVTRAMGVNNALVSANAISDYSYINARDSTPGEQIARCVTGLGPSGTENNTNIGGIYFDESRIAFAQCGTRSSAIIQPRAAINLDTSLGVINIGQCRAFATTAEGIYTCTMTNSSIVKQSVRFGVYFTGRSKLLNI